MNYEEMSTREIKESLGFGTDEIVDPMKFAEKMEVDVFETSLEQKQDGQRIVCAIVDKEKPSVFYHKCLVDGHGTERVAITYALAHRALGNPDSMMVTNSTIMSEQEELLIYEMLMPQNRVAEELRNGASINDLAREFQVPKRCVRERLDAMPASLTSFKNCD